MCHTALPGVSFTTPAASPVSTTAPISTTLLASVTFSTLPTTASEDSDSKQASPNSFTTVVIAVAASGLTAGVLFTLTIVVVLLIFRKRLKCIRKFFFQTCSHHYILFLPLQEALNGSVPALVQGGCQDLKIPLSLSRFVVLHMETGKAISLKLTSLAPQHFTLEEMIRRIKLLHLLMNQ